MQYVLLLLWYTTKYRVYQLQSAGLSKCIQNPNLCTLKSVIKVQDIYIISEHFFRPRQPIRAYPFMKKENFHPRQDVYYKNYTKLLSNISKTYHSKTFIVTIYFQDVYIFKKFPFNTSYHVLDYYQRLQSSRIKKSLIFIISVF